MVLSLLLTPIGRYVAGAIVILLILSGVYLKIKSNAVAGMEAAAQADALRRTQNALKAASDLQFTPDRLRQHDSNERVE
jgi:hypothetical protein